MATSDPNNRKNILKAMIARGDQLEGFNAPVAAKPATVAPVSTPAAPAKEAGWGAKLSNLGAQAVGGLSKGVGRTLSLAGTAADYVTPDVGTLGKASTFLGKGLNIVTPKALEKYNPLTAIGSGLQAADTKMSDYAESKLGTRSLNPVSLLGAGAQKLGQTAQDVSTQLSGVSKDALSSKIGRGLGEGTAMFLGGGAGAKAGQALGNAASKFVPSALSKYAPSLAPKLGTFAANSPRLASMASKVPGFLGSSVGFTEGASVAGQGRLANKKELGAGLAFDVGTAGLGRLAKFGADKLLGSSLRPSKKQAEELFKQYGVQMDDLVRKYDLKGSAQGSLAKIKPQLDETWSMMKEQSKNAKPLTNEVYDEIEAKLIKKMLGEADTLGKQKTAELIKEAVDDIRPLKGTRTGPQLLDDIKILNQTLFNYGERGILGPKQLKSLDSAMKGALKNYLPESVNKGYTKYAELSVLKDILNSEVVRRVVARNTIGAGSGAMVGGAQAISTGGDWKKIATNSIVGGLMGSAIGRLTSSPAVLSRSGQALDAARGGLSSDLPKLVQRAATSGQLTAPAMGSQAPSEPTGPIPQESAFAGLDAPTPPMATPEESANQMNPEIARIPILRLVAEGKFKLSKKDEEEMMMYAPEMADLLKEAKAFAKSAPGKGLSLPVKDVDSISQSKSIERQFKDLAAVLAKIEGKMGPVEGKLRTLDKWDPDFMEAQAMIQSLLGPVARKVMQEVGALTDSDLESVRKVMPQLGDTPEVAANKLNQLIYNTRANREQLLNDFNDAGYNVKSLMSDAEVELKPGEGKKLSASALKTLSEAKSLSRQFNELNTTLTALQSKVGPVGGKLNQLNPYDADTKKLQAAIQLLTNPTARTVMMEVGALTAGDLERVETVLPQLTDTPEVAMRKLNRIISNMEKAQVEKRRLLTQAGYRLDGGGTENTLEAAVDSDGQVLDLDSGDVYSEDAPF